MRITVSAHRTWQPGPPLGRGDRPGHQNSSAGGATPGLVGADRLLGAVRPGLPVVQAGSELLRLGPEFLGRRALVVRLRDALAPLALGPRGSFLRLRPP